jgi:hypothetical protein
MARAKITQREIETLRTASRRSGKTLYLWDTHTRGLGLRVLADGHGAWLVQKWIGGRRGKMARLVIGHHPPMTIDEARRQAREGAPHAVEQALSGKSYPAQPAPDYAP